ncbi:hypothetical protein U1839_00255 [Sphingomonas sp. RT2P30]|uniref:hypothetical protein n=1 Tax=Parasphingomonas halimpatiens TaxID=3096162 RepID=UPI002FCBFEE2
MNDIPSERVVDQRIRNRIMEAVDTLALGRAGVREVGADDYFEYFYDWVRDGVPNDNSAMTDQERTGLANLGRLVNIACDATRPIHDDEELIATGWPDRLAPEAQTVLALFNERGRFPEDDEHHEPARS